MTNGGAGRGRVGWRRAEARGLGAGAPGAVGGQDGEVGGGEVEGGEFGVGHPPQCKVFARMRRRGIGGELGDPGMEFDGQVGIGVAAGRERRDEREGAAELFTNLAMQGGGRVFAGLYFSAGKFPLKGEVFAGRTLRDEDAIVIALEQHAADGKWSRGGNAAGCNDC